MPRTKLKDRKLPDYTRGEEIFNMVSHIVGGGFGVVYLISCVAVAAVRKNTMGIITSFVFGICVILLYTMSSIYHGLKPSLAKKVLQVLDHCAVYLMIAGTYTPIALCAIRKESPALAWMIFSAVWGLTVLATVFTAIDLKQYRVFSMICYIGIGWGVIFAAKQLYNAISFSGFALLLSGGILYTIGAVLYGLGRKKRYAHSIFHLFVLLGSVMHYFCIILYVL